MFREPSSDPETRGWDDGRYRCAREAVRWQTMLPLQGGSEHRKSMTCPWKNVQPMGFTWEFLHRVFMWGVWFRWGLHVFSPPNFSFFPARTVGNNGLQERVRRRAREAPNCGHRYRSENVGIYQQFMDS